MPLIHDGSGRSRGLSASAAPPKMATTMPTTVIARRPGAERLACRGFSSTRCSGAVDRCAAACGASGSLGAGPPVPSGSHPVVNDPTVPPLDLPDRDVAPTIDRMRAPTTVCAAALVAVLAASCSGGGSDARPAGSEPPTSAPAAVSTTAPPTTPVTTTEATPATSTTPTTSTTSTTSTTVAAEPSDYPPQPDGVPWPTGEWTTAPVPDGVDVAAIDAAVATSFGADDNPARMRALLVVDHGSIVYERYHPLDGPDTVFESFSVAKSVTSALIGMLVDDGRLDVDAPAPIEEWRGDERADITTADLLHMSSGLTWQEDYTGGTVIPMFRSDDWAEYAIEQPLESEPGTVWEYSTGTTAILAEIVADEVGGPEALTEFIETRLEEPLGIESTELLRDPTGQFAGGLGFDSTARDFARFGYLYLRGGLWDGQRVLSEDWIEYSATPSPTSTIYGAQWWLDGPTGTMTAKGLFGQHILVDPEHDLVIVSNATAGGDSWTPLQVAYDAFTAGR